MQAIFLLFASSGESSILARAIWQLQVWHLQAARLWAVSLEDLGLQLGKAANRLRDFKYNPTELKIWNSGLDKHQSTGPGLATLHGRNPAAEE